MQNFYYWIGKVLKSPYNLELVSGGAKKNAASLPASTQKPNNHNEKLQSIEQYFYQSPGYLFALEQALQVSKNNNMNNIEHAKQLAACDYYNWLRRATYLESVLSR